MKTNAQLSLFSGRTAKEKIPVKYKKLPKPTESKEQEQVILYARNIKHFPNTHAIPNGVFLKDRNSAFAIMAKQKREGLLKGMPDIFIPYPRNGWHGLYIEMKKESGGQLSDQQAFIISGLKAEGYRVEVCRGFAEAKKVIDDYSEAKHE